MKTLPTDQSPKFVIWTFPFSETSGGAISLHLLCHRLNEAGERAMLWPADRPLPRLFGNPRRWLGAARYRLTRGDQRFCTGPFPNPVAKRSDLEGAIVVYPEIVSGNPLHSQGVVRWFLHKPGYHTGVTDYGSDELYFFVVDAFNDQTVNPSGSHRLNLMWINEVYRDHGNVQREGSCYMLRKGRDREIVHPMDDSTKLDGLPHQEVAQEFNRRKHFYCYDLYTMYTIYAAICGCIPIVVPEPGTSKNNWQLPEDRYGQAYGEEDIPWAIGTRGKLLEKLAVKRREEDMEVHQFIQRCRAWYEARARPSRVVS